MKPFKYEILTETSENDIVRVISTHIPCEYITGDTSIDELIECIKKDAKNNECSIRIDIIPRTGR